MKKLFTLIVMLCAGTFAFILSAQTTQLATLLHEGEVSIFYGADALKQAYTAAADGDVITLSAGQFDAVDISKELTIRGAGMGLEDLGDVNYPTIVKGDVKVKAPITIEGLYFSSYFYPYCAVTANMCRFYIFSYYDTSVSATLNFANCHFDKQYLDYFNVNAVNCTFKGEAPGVTTYGTHRGTYLNCTIIITTSQSYYTNSTLQNCIIKMDTNQKFDSTTQCYNCLFCGKYGTTDYVSSHSTNTYLPSVTTVFKDGTYYELMDEYKNILGSDGTQPGIYGGNIGFSQTPNIPQISKFKVSPRTSADGKLSVEIEVQGIE